ncbi:TonB-dependent receptor [Cellulophaga baltica]|uniref:TonB-dependent receptor n=1 Tax=Cellulophaga TaxID=104264 RepID=UPI001C06BD96|nr:MULTISPECIES: TonB-dependent receptor [Cellulophaga]MBU2996466.1 TonB-dependent receptor [Cellulophaga baltica]MDO6767860.1 TonB-dependent receptor [Cellulophaga sp. 1_MG-2023]
MLKKLLAFVAIFGMISFAMAQTSTINGKVVTLNGKPIADVTVRLVNTSFGVMTKKDGKFILNNVPLGDYTLEVSSIGYAKSSITVNVISNKSTTIKTIKLQEKDEALQEVVVNGRQNKYNVKTPSTSLRLKTEIVNLPQNIQVISSDLLQDQQATSIMDGVIRNVSGVTMLEHWGHFARINMRGFRLPAFRNGINIEDSWGPLSEDMSTVERIEFVKGPAGFMMSAGEPGGFYNVVTKKPTINKVAQVSVATGSFDSYRATADFGGKLTENGKLLYRLNGMYQTADSHRGGEDVERFGITPSLTYNISDKTALTAQLSVQDAESYIGSAYVFAPTADGYGSLDRDFKFTDSNYPATDIQEVSLFTNFSHQFSDNWSFESQFAYMRYDQVGNSIWLWSLDSDTGDATRYISIWDALSVGKYFQAYLNGKFDTGTVSHKILGGFDFSEKKYWADFNQYAIIDVDEPFNIYNPTYGNSVLPEFDRSVDLQFRDGVYSYGSINRSIYFQDEIGFLQDKIRLTLAGRYTNLTTDGKDENDEKFSPRFGLSVDVIPTLKAYALYDQSFIGQTGLSESGDYFDPVEANDIEGGIKKTFFDGRLKTSLGVYQITKQNVLVTDPDNVNFSIQLGEVQSKGVEFDLQGEVTPELNVILNYANTNVEITEDSDPDLIGTRVAGHAKHVTNGWVNYTFAEESKLRGFGASLGYQYQIDRSTWAWGSDNESDLPDYFRLDGGLSWQNSKLRIQANVNNILDEYLYSGSDYGTYLYWQSEPGINGRLTLTYSF